MENLTVHTIGSQLKVWREARGLDQKDAAELLGLAYSSYQNYELGTRGPRPDAMEKFAKGGINLNWLLTNQGNMTIEPVSYKGSESSTVLHAADTTSSRVGRIDFDPLLLQSVIDFLLRWIDDHQVVIAKDKYGAVISVLYRVAAARGCVEIHELEQVLRLVA